MSIPTLTELVEKRCHPCRGGVEPFSPEKARDYIASLPGWELAPGGRVIRRTYTMRGFLEAVDLVTRIAPLAEQEDHHPDIHLTGYRTLTIELSTHAIGGLSENDFILAAKIEQLPKEVKG